MTNAELIEQAGKALNDLGVQKSDDVITTDNQTTGDFMNRKQVEALMDLTVGQSDWLAACDLRMRRQRAGEVPRMEIDDIVMEGAEENDGGTVASVPTTDRVEYRCRKFHATWFLTREDLREAAATGESDYEGKVRRMFGKKMGNNMALVFLLGDTTLGAGSRRLRLLNRIDGVMKKIRASSYRASTTRGSAFDPAVFDAILDLMPEQYAEDPDLRWFYARKIQHSYDKYLRDLGEGSDLKDAAMVTRNRYAPLGIPPIIVPQMPTDLGFDTLDGSTADADLVTDDGDGTISLRVDTVLGGYNAANAGRRLRVTFNSTGQSEVCTVAAESSHNVIHTTGSLGQSTISTTASGYALDVADCTPILLTNPKNLCLVMCDEIRAYRKTEQEYERIRIDVWLELDALLLVEDAAVLHDGIVPTRMTFGS